ncbi:hypothetical protein G8770_23590 [Aestuariicella hydrocarbonica]|uniref:Uncharacterized protein n=1 Tax=Pseudomaricurvus hydrocarbonicus TaxID=1470433 RepID=A0A9E5MQR6_9GAMM|nr:hypothetical protein [Aestuariicella hydrocarbonica]NHO68547.1 hypothetical protein [Aestuariicella hydrocarbonica]
MRILTNIIVLLSAITVIGCASKPVPSLALGDRVDFRLLQDQMGNTFTHQNKMKLVLFAQGMGSKDLVQDSLEAIDTACMSDGELVYLANISGMPTIISKLVAIPRMRDYPYPIWLDLDGLATEGLPSRDEQVTVLSIAQQSITETEYFSDVAALSKRLLTVCDAAPLAP